MRKNIIIILVTVFSLIQSWHIVTLQKRNAKLYNMNLETLNSCQATLLRDKDLMTQATVVINRYREVCGEYAKTHAR